MVGDILRDSGKAVAIQADVGERADVGAAVGTPGVLVNNAGVYRFAPMEEVTEAEFRRQFDTNVLSTILMTQEAVNASARAAAVSSISAAYQTRLVPNSLVYSASKAAVDAITKALGHELAGRNIRVNAIAPGMTETEGLAVVGIEGETAKSMGASLPMGRPDDIARVAVFLASYQSGWLTGERISASGGRR